MGRPRINKNIRWLLGYWYIFNFLKHEAYRGNIQRARMPSPYTLLWFPLPPPQIRGRDFQAKQLHTSLTFEGCQWYWYRPHLHCYKINKDLARGYLFYGTHFIHLVKQSFKISWVDRFNTSYEKDFLWIEFDNCNGKNVWELLEEDLLHLLDYGAFPRFSSSWWNEK